MKATDILSKEELKQLKILKKNHPIYRSFYTGLYGWERVNNGFDLSKAIFKSEQAAKLDRHNTLKRCV